MFCCGLFTRDSDMATIQVLLIGFLVLVHDVAMKGFPPNLKEQSQRPHLTGCVSREMESFYCSWSVGTFQNLTEPGDLRLFYTYSILQNMSSREWKECPKYTLLRENECYFDKRHTQVWVAYKIELRSRDQSIIYDEDQFTVETIGEP
ncbi:growth hormone receptor b [Alosa sapidissima]|uniref:growth hormone receptor b n=1 Tax=Alosa sapidissima TaxID=34773 RepID=UPI001C097806|nr:growth hormone receptor b [Alosa sapidissima]